MSTNRPHTGTDQELPSGLTNVIFTATDTRKALQGGKVSWNNQNASTNGVTERGFELQVQGHKVPGVYWAPEQADRLVLLGHGGTTHKKVEYITRVAMMLAARGIAAMAIDGPGHGERASAAAKSQPVDFARIWNEGGGHDGMLADWRAALDFIEAEIGARPTGVWGLSMGTMMGLPIAATDNRIKVALLGLMGDWGPNSAQLLELAPKVTCPVRFIMQWDDEIVPRKHCLNLFGAIGSQHKTLHANPGIHQSVPAFEIAGSVDYLDKHLS